MRKSSLKRFDACELARGAPVRHLRLCKVREIAEQAEHIQSNWMAELTIKALLETAAEFAPLQAKHSEPSLYGRNDGKAVGTYLEGRFVAHLLEKHHFSTGNAALGIDLPSINVDIKTTSKRQPQSSCPYRNARQKVYGLGYSLLVFVYEKADIAKTQSTILKIANTIFIDAEHTADYQLTATIADYLAKDATDEDLAALFMDRTFPWMKSAPRNLPGRSW